MGLIVEILTGSLTGVGHTGPTAEAGNLVYLQLIDPDAFAGLGADVCGSSCGGLGVHRIKKAGDALNASPAGQSE